MDEQTIGRYSVLRSLGMGGMAEVFLCRLTGIGGFEKHVVVKRIRADIVNDFDFITMFLDEARLAANLNHPNVIQTFEVDQDGGAPYIAMEYVKGATLAAVLLKLRDRQGERPYGHLAHVLAGVCSGLDHAHTAVDPGGKPLNIVHRDVSPQNIIISRDGTPKIFDFGIAKARGSLSRTGTNRIKGKYAYMAPEQLRAQAVDARADIYALGVCLYEATTGRRPFTGDTDEELLAVRLDGRFRRPSELVEGFPIELEHVILGAMWPDPEGRPSAQEVREVLVAYAAKVRSNQTEVSAWLQEMFANEALEVGAAYDTTGSNKTPRRRTPEGPVPVVSMPTTGGTGRRRRLAAGVLAAAVLAAAAGFVYVLRTHREEPAPVAQAPAPAPAPAPVPVPTPPPPPPAVASSDPVITKYLDEAEQLASDNHLDSAQAVLDKATAIQPTDPAIATRLAQISDRVFVAQTRAAAHDALSHQDYPGAIALAQKVLARHGDDADAGQVVAEATAAVRRPDPRTRKPPSAPPPRTVLVRPAPGSSAPVEVAPVKPPETAGSGSAIAVVTPPPPPSEPIRPAPLDASPAPPVVHVDAGLVRPKIGSLDAVPALGNIDVNGPLPNSEIQSAMSRSLGALRACYQVAAKAASKTPALSIRISFEIDEDRAVRNVHVGGDTLGIAACVSEATSHVRTRQAPDVGTAAVTVVVKFQPTGG